MGAVVAIVVILVVLGIIAAARSIKIVQQYEKGIIYRFGRVSPEIRGPGLTIIRPIGDRLQKVNMQIIAMAVPAQEGITRDNVSVRVDAVVYFRVVDPIKATVNVQRPCCHPAGTEPHCGRLSSRSRWTSCWPSARFGEP